MRDSQLIEALDCIASAGASCLQTDVTLQNVTSVSQIEMANSDLLQDYMQRAIARAVQEPISESAKPMARDALTANTGNLVAERKTVLLSSVERPGTPHAEGQDGKADSSKAASPGDLDALSAKVRSLYMDLTEYSAAWGVGQKTQRDLSHILKGQ